MTMTQEQSATAETRDASASASPPHQPANVGGDERWLSTVGGSALVLFGLSRISVKGLALAGLGAALIQRGVTGHCAVYQAIGRNSAGEGAKPGEYMSKGVHVEQSFTVNRPAAELYAFWRNFENLPRFMTHLKEVKVLDEKRSHWLVDGPAGRTLHWDAEIINDEPERLVAWRSLGGADVDNAGSVRFVDAPGDRGTEVKVVLDYIPPAGKLGAAVAWAFGKSAQQQVQEDLRHFKQMMEAGEIPTSNEQPRGNCKEAAAL